MQGKNNQIETAGASQNRVQYVCASIPAWREQAAGAIIQGQSENDFLLHCHPDNWSNARKAYRMELAGKRELTPEMNRALIQLGLEITHFRNTRVGLRHLLSAMARVEQESANPFLPL